MDGSINNGGVINTDRLASVQARLQSLASPLGASPKPPLSSPGSLSRLKDVYSHGPDAPSTRQGYAPLEDEAKAATAVVVATESAETSEGLPLDCKAVLIPEPGSRKEQWDTLILVFILYSAVMVPFRIGFSAEAEVRAARPRSH
jgi:hypothetical protein